MLVNIYKALLRDDPGNLNVVMIFMTLQNSEAEFVRKLIN